MKHLSSFRTLPLVVVVEIVVVVSASLAVVDVVFVVVALVVVAVALVVVVVASVVVVLTVVVVLVVVVAVVVVIVVVDFVDSAVVVVVFSVVVVVVVVTPSGNEPLFLAVSRPWVSRASKPSSFADVISSSVAFATSSGDVFFGAVASASYSAFARVSAALACRRRRPVDSAATDTKLIT